jgi:hypothetical protein
MLAVGSGFVIVFVIVNYLIILNKYEKGLVKTILNFNRKERNA